MSSFKHKNLLAVMARMRSLVSDDQTVPDCVEVDWNVPRHFSAAARERFTAVGHSLAACLQKALSGFGDDGFEVTMGPITECFAGVLSEQVNQSGHYHLPFLLADKGQAGFVSIPFETCTILIRRILGDPEAQIGQEGTLSVLEESILQDAVFTIADALMAGLSNGGRITMRRGEQLIHDAWPLSFCGPEELSQVRFEADRDSGRLEVLLYLLDDVIDPLLGVSRPPVSPQRLKQIPADIVEQVRNVGVDISVSLNPAMLTLENILSMEKDDVVLLDHKVTAPANVVFNQQTGFKAWPAKSAGRWAAVIAEKKTDHN